MQATVRYCVLKYVRSCATTTTTTTTIELHTILGPHLTNINKVRCAVYVNGQHTFGCKTDRNDEGRLRILFHEWNSSPKTKHMIYEQESNKAHIHGNLQS